MNLFSRFIKPRARRNYRWSIEQLESRALLSTFVVINNADSGLGSLRQAIIDANKTAAADVIEFHVDGPVNSRGLHHVHLETALPTISQPLTIAGETQTAFDGTRFEIHGKVAGQVNGFYVKAANTTIRGLSIWDFGKGVWIAAPNVTIDGNEIWECDDGVFAKHSFDGTINNNYLHSNWYSGVQLVQGGRFNVVGNEIEGNLKGIVPYNSANNVFEDNEVTGNTQEGVAQFGIGNVGNTYRYNVIADNGGNGMTISVASTFTLVEYNDIARNANGIVVGGSGVHDTMIRYNNIYDNDASGLIFAANYNTAEFNVITGNGLRGLYLSADHNTINSNVITANPGTGLSIVGDYNTGTGNEITGNNPNVSIWEKTVGNSIE